MFLLFSVDASRHMKGAMVWDGGDKSISTVKVVLLKGKPHLCLFANRDIATGEEISIKFGLNCIIIIILAYSMICLSLNI